MNVDQLAAFDLPEGAMQAIIENGYKLVDMNDGVSRMSGHDKGVGYKFLTIQERDEMKSREMGFDVPRKIPVIQWFKDRKTKPMEMIKELPEGLLRFNKLGECVGGRYKEAYDRFLEGQDAEGLSLNRWTDASDSDVFTLTNSGIHTVEQFAELKRERVQDLFGGYFNELWEKAVAFTQKDKVDDSKVAELVDTVVELRKQLAQMQAQIDGEPSGGDLISEVAEAEVKAKAKAKSKSKAKSKVKA